MHMIHMSSSNVRKRVVYYFSHIAVLAIVIIFCHCLLNFKGIPKLNYEDLVLFEVLPPNKTPRNFQCLIFMIAAFRGNKESLELVRSYSKKVEVMRSLNVWNAVIFIVSGTVYSLIYALKNLQGTRYQFNAGNAMYIYEQESAFGIIVSPSDQALILFTFCMAQMLNDNVQSTIHLIDSLFRREVFKSLWKRLVYSLCTLPSLVFVVVTNLLIYRFSFDGILMLMAAIYPNVAISIPVLINLAMIPNQALEAVLGRSSLVAVFFFFSVFGAINLT